MARGLIHTSLIFTSFTLGGCGPKDPPIIDDSGGTSSDTGGETDTGAVTGTGAVTSTTQVTTDTDPTMPPMTSTVPMTTNYYEDTGCVSYGCYPYTTVPYYYTTTEPPDTVGTITTFDTDCGSSGTLDCTFTSGESGDPCGSDTGGCPDTGTGGSDTGSTG